MHGLSVNDPSSFSRPDSVVVTDLSLNLSVSFEQKIFKGYVDLVVQKVDSAATELILDTQDLDIFEIYDTDSNAKLNYIINSPVAEFGSKLSITLPNKSAQSLNIRIQYATTAKASGLQWLEPEQTAGKVHPFVFSQFQPIHARSVLPCQDTPAVKATYRASITAPSHLTVLMSAVRQDKVVNGDIATSTFVQKVPICAYLIAIAIGAIEGKKIGPRSTVWAEEKLIDQAVYEFGETEMQLRTAEDICGPYVWGIYDLLVLPPSFPFGGMENPCLTFVTPTLLAGDRSLANVVAHEIAHSWTGNLVTNVNWEHFWLNEGFTVFIERKIVGRLTNAEEQDFDAHCGTVSLKETVSVLGTDNPLTCLVVNLEKTHPDDAFSRVPYEKGHTFLRYLENVVGGPSEFEPFLRKYFDHFKFKTLNSNDFKAYFENFFAKNDSIKKIDWNAWFYSPGMPPVVPAYNTKVLELCNEYKTKLLSNSLYKKEDFKHLDMKVLIHVLQEIFEGDPQPVEKLKAIDDLLGLSAMQNSEVKFMWLRIALKARWEEKIQETLDWINVVGRMKYVRPLHRDLYNWEKARQQAITNYYSNCHTMMHVVSYTARKDLHLV
ncbi:hypothetical protein PPYR_00237 [Photinus pyralis]|uniref:Peptidase M1 leukotriene A4 hydrolase/aminopeptidase C-terminal domain-containing protein n=1 Tax=Photinus pyralis TaxID=7054 RepID=A0A5N4B0Z3_PHOPY|nr:leukotriene A-4 hydrolase [Photinus pyralis]KAB0803267.1 hypothetical protein PPYR_00237 [Photinus pyralis]